MPCEVCAVLIKKKLVVKGDGTTMSLHASFTLIHIFLSSTEFYAWNNRAANVPTQF